MAAQNNQPMGWKGRLKQLISDNNKNHGVRNKIVSVNTKKDREEILFQSFNQLREHGFLIKNPINFQERHFIVLLRLWLDQGLSASTIQKKASVIRVFCGWINKGNMIKTLEHYITPEEKHRVTRRQATEVDKSWNPNGVSSKDMIAKMELFDVRLAAQMKMIEAFGLRREEAISFRPRRAVALGSDTNSIVIEFGTKGGRIRTLPIDSDERREALDYALKQVSTMEEHIGWLDLTLQQAIRKFKYGMEKFDVTKKGLGVTAHGLRHEYLSDGLELLIGEASPVRGGDASKIDPVKLKEAQLIISARAGHSRPSITTAYCGSFKIKK